MKHPLVVILAAGEGKRLQPLITPKALLPFLGRPLISWLIDDLTSVGFKRFLTLIPFKQQSAFDFLAGQTVVQSKPLGMADALLSAKNVIKDEDFVVVNADDLLAPSIFKDFFKTIKKNRSHPFVTGLNTKKHLPAGYFQLKDGQVVGIVEKPAVGYEPSQFVNLVLHYFPHSAGFLKLLSQSKSFKDDLYETALNKLLKAQAVGLVEANDYFVPLKYPHHLLSAVSLFLDHKFNPKKAVHPTARIMSGAVIKNSYIGENVIVGNNALIRDSLIEKDSVVGYNSEIARSYVGPKSWFHCNYVGDSVIEGQVNLGSGARLANFRFDEQPVSLQQLSATVDTELVKFGAVLGQGAKLGINASIMPGITIGDHALVGSGVVLNQPVKPHCKVFVKQKPVFS